MRQKWGKKVRRSEEERNEMDGKMGERKVRRTFTPEQKFEILKDIERCRTIKEGLAKHEIVDSLYRKWKRQLAVGVPASADPGGIAAARSVSIGLGGLRASQGAGASGGV